MRFIATRATVNRDLGSKSKLSYSCVWSFGKCQKSSNSTTFLWKLDMTPISGFVKSNNTSSLWKLDMTLISGFFTTWTDCSRMFKTSQQSQVSQKQTKCHVHARRRAKKQASKYSMSVLQKKKKRYISVWYCQPTFFTRQTFTQTMEVWKDKDWQF
jgi:hypothetical protein